MTLPVPWLLFPAVLGFLSLGSGLLLEWLSGVKLPGALRLAAGHRLRRPDWWAAGAGLGTFAAYAAPVVLSGQAGT